MTRTATHLRGDASSKLLRGCLAACLVAALFAAPTAAGYALTAPAGEVAAESEVGFTAFNDKLFLEARRNGVPVVLYFEAEGCAPCREMHARTFRAPAVLEASAGIRFFRVNLSSGDDYVELVQKSFHVFGAPTLILFGPDGKESARRIGFVPPDDFARMLGASRKPLQST